MTPCFAWNFDLVLEGSTTKIKDKQVPGMCIYIYIGKYWKMLFWMTPLSQTWHSLMITLQKANIYQPPWEKENHFSSLEGISNNLMWVFPKIRGTPKWMVYNGKPY